MSFIGIPLSLFLVAIRVHLCLSINVRWLLQRWIEGGSLRQMLKENFKVKWSGWLARKHLWQFIRQKIAGCFVLLTDYSRRKYSAAILQLAKHFWIMIIFYLVQQPCIEVFSVLFSLAFLFFGPVSNYIFLKKITLIF